jgi:glycosyltransferase involved in cell wall biosynthesis
MRVLLLSWRDRTHPDGGGSETYVESVAAGLAARGHDVTLLCPRHDGLRRSLVRQGFRILPRGGRLTVYGHGLLHLLRARGSYDVVVDVVNGLPFLSPWVRRRGVVALVHHLHQEQWRIIYPGPGGRIGWWVESWLFPRVYRHVPVLTVSEASRRDLIGLGFAPGQVTVAHNGTPPLPPPRGTRSETPLLCVLARLVPHKRIELAVDAVADLAEEFPGLQLELVGDGWWREEIEDHVARRGVGDRVTLLGRVSEQDKVDALARAWLMVLPSVKEGWGIAVLEAAAVGTATVACRSAGGTAESVHDGVTGLLVEDDEIPVAVRRLLLDTSEREAMGAAARNYAEGFTWDATTTVVEGVLRGVREEATGLTRRR